MLPAPVVADDALQGALEVPGNRRIGALVDGHAGSRVRYVDERRRTLRPLECTLDLPRDLDQLSAPLTPEGDLAHVVRPQAMLPCFCRAKSKPERGLGTWPYP